MNTNTCPCNYCEKRSGCAFCKDYNSWHQSEIYTRSDSGLTNAESAFQKMVDEYGLSYFIDQ